MNYWKVILATVVIFGAGVLTGGLMVNFVDHPHLRNQRRPQPGIARSQTNNFTAAIAGRGPEFPPPRLAEVMSRQFVQQLNVALQLTPDQRGKIEKIITDGQEQNREIWTNVAPKMRAVNQDVTQRIRAELTPEQLKPFEQLLKQQRPPRRPPSGTNAPEFSPERQAHQIQWLQAERVRDLTNSTQSMPFRLPIDTNAQVQKIIEEAERIRAMTNAPMVILPPAELMPPINPTH